MSSLFWDDLGADMEDPAFAADFAAQSEQITATDDRVNEEFLDLQDLLTIAWEELQFTEGHAHGFVTVAEESVGGVRHGREKTRVITRGASGQHYAWTYLSGWPTDAEDLPPDHSGWIDVEMVRPVEETITITKWVSQ